MEPTFPEYDHSKLKPLLTQEPQEQTDALYLPGIHLRSLDTESADLEDSAIEVAARIMRDQQDEDPKLALDAAKATMQWMGKGTKARTTIFAQNAQVNQLTEDPEKSKHILTSLRDSISLLTNGQQIEGDQ